MDKLESTSGEITSISKPEKTYRFSLSRKALIGMIVSAIIIAVGLVLYFTSWWQPIYQKVLPAQTTLTILDSQTLKPVEGAQVTLKKEVKKTDVQGKVKFTQLSAFINYKVEISKDGYKNNESYLKFSIGANDLAPIKLIRISSTLDVTVSNYISQEKIADVQIQVGDQKFSTDAKGVAKIDNIIDNNITLNLAKDGFIANQKEIDLKSLSQNSVSIELVPTGQIVFESNRSGKVGIYTCNLDGSGQKEILVPQKGEIKTFLPSPNQKYVLFSSTHEGIKKEDSSDTYKEFYYLADLEKGVYNRISETLLYSNAFAKWLYDSSGFVLSYTESGTADELDKSIIEYYNIANKKMAELTKFTGWIGYGVINITPKNDIYYYVSANDSQEIGLFKYSLANSKNEKVSDKKITNLAWLEFNKIFALNIYSEKGESEKYSYNLSDGTLTKIDEFSIKANNYFINSSGDAYAMILNRDGQNNIYLQKTGADKEEKITNINSVTGSIYWLEDKYLIFSVSKTDETARYITAIGNNNPKKITNEYIQTGYGYNDY